ncbi:hypothetical protein PAHAL_8G055700 [Panicum hallii]|uniref:Uncharacterized protein n=1 Tax=Panicum hallii TaxID=206008 RepID=A0A2T8I7T4_9POAL|nr:hypothetical protein PAHAL_8G055700 [Panicum hallii]
MTLEFIIRYGMITLFLQLSQNVEVLQHHGGQWHPTWIFPDDSLQWIQLSLLTKILPDGCLLMSQ